MKILVTGSSGGVGSAAVRHFDRLGHVLYGFDNNMRSELFGPGGDTSRNLERLLQQTERFYHFPIDVRDAHAVSEFFRTHRLDAVLHCAAQPSHEKSRQVPAIDFAINAGGTMNLLEATRLFNPDATFILMSSNKVYGDAVNDLPLCELPTRYDYAADVGQFGIAETFRVDRSLHSPFGASKLAADVMAQEYGRYFGLKVGVFRASCISGPSWAAVEGHGFLSYLVKTAVRKARYTVYGFGGKQVRDQLHVDDLVLLFQAFLEQPRSGEVYNVGGGRKNSASIIECVQLVEAALGRPITVTYSDQVRRGDHRCYISDIRKACRDFYGWTPTRSLGDIVEELARSERDAAMAHGSVAVA